jgi:hypothetical protein
MLQLNRYLAWYLILLSVACRNASSAQEPFLTQGNETEDSSKSSGIVQAVTTEIGGETPPPSVPMTQEPTKVPEEGVNPPSNISGSYLICAEAKAATDALPEAVVNCGLRDDTTNNKVNMDVAFVSKVWSYQNTGSGNLAVTFADLSKSIEWHIAVTLKGTSAADVQAQLNAIKFYINVQDAAGVKFQEVATLGPMFTQWLALNGAKIPTNSVIGGSGKDNLYHLNLCRMYVDQEVIPGKLVPHYNNPNTSICYAIVNGLRVQSQKDDPSQTVYRSDVLRITDGIADDYFEWLPASNGIRPATAVVTGMDAQGNSLYSCRHLIIDGAIVEQSPGVLRPGATACFSEYYGVRSDSNYQVLSWKKGATQKVTTPVATAQ